MEYKKILGEELCEQLLFIHAFSGCDTTSSMFGIGKGTSFRKLIGNEQLKDISHTFTSYDTPKEEIELAGEKAMIVLYNGDLTKDINSHRYKVLISKVTAAQSFVQPQRLTPTKAATKYHSYRTYVQIMQWKGKMMTENQLGMASKGRKICSSNYRSPCSTYHIVESNTLFVQAGLFFK